MIEVRLGITDISKELTLEINQDIDDVRKSVDSALEGDGILWLVDKKGKQIGVPVRKLAYVEISSEAGPRSVGFSR